MTDYFTLEPEVAGELGQGTALDESTHPPTVTSVDYAFHDWLGDDLVTSFPAFLVTEKLAAQLTASGLGRFELRPADITLADEAEDLMGDAPALPPFRWLHVTGTAGQDDVGLTDRADLVVSQAALDVLRQCQLDNCDVEPYEG